MSSRRGVKNPKDLENTYEKRESMKKETTMHYTNPVVCGFYPDPSVCRVDDMYYLACSSFLNVPGVPLFESSDLVNWTPIGHCLTRPSQIDLSYDLHRPGIFAPTLRFFRDRFYMTTTDVGGRWNFIVTTDDIHGEWSDPIPVDQPGIDPEKRESARR